MFNFTDHLGNIRLSYSKDPATNVLKIIEENHYYPFGLKHSGYNSDKMMYSKEGSTVKIKPVPPLFVTSYSEKYNGQSWETDLGINITAMDYRQYDNALGRFYGVDVLAELMPSITPNHFGFNNPVFWSDPSGLISQKSIQSMWDNSAENASTTWYNDGADNFDKEDGSGSVNRDGDYFEYSEALPNVNVQRHKGGLLKYNSGDIVEGHVYNNGKYYQGWRDKRSSKQLDVFQSGLDGFGNVPVLGEAFDFTNGVVSGLRGNYGEAGVNFACMIPIGGNFVSGGKIIYKNTPKVYDVYHGLDASGAIKYVGITSRNPLVRFSEHAGSIGTGRELLRYDVISSGLTKQQARVLEQTIINTHGLEKNGGQLLNRINSIAPKNWEKFGIN
mgnify:CR=1 FL=1